MVLLQVLRSLVGNTFKTHNYASHTLDEHTACVHQLGQTDRQFIQTYTYSTSSQHKLYNEICHVYLHMCVCPLVGYSVQTLFTSMAKVNTNFVILKSSHFYNPSFKCGIYAPRVSHFIDQL